MKCLIIDPMHESLFPMLREIGWEGVYKPTLTREQIKAELHQYSGLIVRSKTKIDRELIGDNPSIKFVGRAGAGLDNLDVAFLKQSKIHVIHAAHGNRDAVGEHTVGLLLSLLRNISISDSQVKSGLWKREENRGTEIMGKTIGIIGYGNMGRAFAKRLSGFDCKVLTYDKYKSGYADSFCAEADLNSLFEETEILSLHIPLTEETRMMINAEFIGRFSKNIVLINTSRGEIVSLSDLIPLHKTGKIRGMALDVLENEKLEDLSPTQQAAFNYLTEQLNVIFTPHIAGWTFESHVKINVALIEKLRAINF